MQVFHSKPSNQSNSLDKEAVNNGRDALTPRTVIYFSILFTSPKCHNSDNHKTLSTFLLEMPWGSSPGGSRMWLLEVPALKLPTVPMVSSSKISSHMICFLSLQGRQLTCVPKVEHHDQSCKLASATTPESLMGHTVPQF